MITRRQINLIIRMGYTEKEAKFIGHCASISGYFLGRQFNAWNKYSRGLYLVQLTRKMTHKRHLKVHKFGFNTHVYHIMGKAIFKAIDKEDSCNRIIHQNETLKNRLLLMDYFLYHKGTFYLASENEKVSYFTETLGIDKPVLPHKAYSNGKHSNSKTIRYFSDKFPVIIPNEHLSNDCALSRKENVLPTCGPPHHLLDSGSNQKSVCLCNEKKSVEYEFPQESMINFLYIDNSMNATDQPFRRYLKTYTGLFQHLNLFKIIYISDSDLMFESAEKTFNNVMQDIKVSRSQGSLDVCLDPSRSQNDMSTMMRFFRIRKAFEEKDVSVFNGVNASFYYENKERFSSEKHNDLYSQWLNKSIKQAGLNSSETDGRLECYLVKHNYKLFGTGLSVSTDDLDTLW